MLSYYHFHLVQLVTVISQLFYSISLAWRGQTYSTFTAPNLEDCFPHKRTYITCATRGCKLRRRVGEKRSSSKRTASRAASYQRRVRSTLRPGALGPGAVRLTLLRTHCHALCALSCFVRTALSCSVRTVRLGTHCHAPYLFLF